MYSSIALLLGHMVGDYWFQSDKMALNKSEKGIKGDEWCLLHCIIYSACVAVFVVFGGWEFVFCDSVYWWKTILGSLIFSFLIAFITHYPIDRTSFAHRWMKWFGTIDFEKATPITNAPLPPALSGNVRTFFVAPIYVAIDNSMHLVLMWILFSVLGK